MDFLVAYETDDLPAFSELVRDLRGTDSRRSTVRDTPLLTAVHGRGDSGGSSAHETAERPEEARLFPGGVKSPVRAYRAVGGDPPVLGSRRGRARLGSGGPRLRRLGLRLRSARAGHADAPSRGRSVTPTSAGGPFGVTVEGELRLAADPRPDAGDSRSSAS